MQHLEEIRDALQDRVSSVVARKTGLHRNTILRIKAGKTKEIHGSTIDKIMAYLRREGSGA